MDKIYSQRIHAKNRIAQRMGLNINRKDYAEIVRMIQEGRGSFVGRQSNRITVFKIEYKNTPMQVVYDSSRKSVVTALPCDTTIECYPRFV